MDKFYNGGLRQESNRMNVEVIPEPICGCDAEAERGEFVEVEL